MRSFKYHILFLIWYFLLGHKLWYYWLVRPTNFWKSCSNYSWDFTNMNGLQASVAWYQGEVRRLKIMLGFTWLVFVLDFLVKWSWWTSLLILVVGLLCYPKILCNFKLMRCSFMFFQDLLQLTFLTCQIEIIGSKSRLFDQIFP